MESVECFRINLTRSFDFHKDIKTLALSNEWHHPTDVGTTFAFFGAHLAIGSLVAASTTNVPIGNFEVCWHDIVDVHVLESGVTVVLEQNEDFVSSLSTNR